MLAGVQHPDVLQRSELHCVERFRQRLGVFESGVREGGRQLGREGCSSLGALGGRGEEQE
jgi:hypothetical protein